MRECIFCQIVEKKIKAKIIGESENFLVFLDIHPHAPGHSLLIPKKHFANFQELPEEYGQEFVKIIKDIMLKLKRVLGTDNFTLGVNEGPLAGQAVFHLHLHIIPRFKNDGGGSIHSVVYNQPKESVEEIYQKIINASES
ncbi:MAG: hydrolase [Candidatus Parcubacteria bacterium]|nr:MAG: hydrolase [Candidatus Parcubacteria bacterium]